MREYLPKTSYNTYRYFSFRFFCAALLHRANFCKHNTQQVFSSGFTCNFQNKKQNVHSHNSEIVWQMSPFFNFHNTRKLQPAKNNTGSRTKVSFFIPVPTELPEPTPKIPRIDHFSLTVIFFLNKGTNGATVMSKDEAWGLGRGKCLALGPSLGAPCNTRMQTQEYKPKHRGVRRCAAMCSKYQNEHIYELTPIYFLRITTFFFFTHTIATIAKLYLLFFFFLIMEGHQTESTSGGLSFSQSGTYIYNTGE